MAPHEWTLEHGYCDEFGAWESWRCAGCTLSGGIKFLDSDTGPRWEPFILGKGRPVPFSADDCDVAREQLVTLRASPEWQQKERELRVQEALWLLRRLSPRVGGNVDRRQVVVHGGDGKRKFRLDLVGFEGSCRVTFKGGNAAEEFESIYAAGDRLARYYGLR